MNCYKIFSICMFVLLANALPVIGLANCGVFRNAQTVFYLEQTSFEVAEAVRKSIENQKGIIPLSHAVAKTFPTNQQTEVRELVERILENPRLREDPQTIRMVEKIFGSVKNFEAIETAFARASFDQDKASYAGPVRENPAHTPLPPELKRWQQVVKAGFWLLQKIHSIRFPSRETRSVKRDYESARAAFEQIVVPFESHLEQDRQRYQLVEDALIEGRMGPVRTARRDWHWSELSFESKVEALEGDPMILRRAVAAGEFVFKDEDINHTIIRTLHTNINGLTETHRRAVIIGNTNLMAKVHEELARHRNALEVAEARRDSYWARKRRLYPFTSEQEHVLRSLQEGNSEPLFDYLAIKQEVSVAIVDGETREFRPPTADVPNLGRIKLGEHPLFERAIHTVMREGLEKSLERGIEIAEDPTQLNNRDVTRFNEDLSGLLDLTGVRHSFLVSQGRDDSINAIFRIELDGWSQLNTELRNIQRLVQERNGAAHPADIAFVYRSENGSVPTRTYFDVAERTIYLSARDLVEMTASETFMPDFQRARDRMLALLDPRSWEYHADVITNSNPFMFPTSPALNRKHTGFSFSEIMVLQKQLVRELDNIAEAIETAIDPTPHIAIAKQLAIKLKTVALKAENYLKDFDNNSGRVIVQFDTDSLGNPTHIRFQYQTLDGSTVTSRIPASEYPGVVHTYELMGEKNAAEQFVFEMGIPTTRLSLHQRLADRFLALHMGESPEETVAYHKTVKIHLYEGLSTLRILHDVPDSRR